MKSPRHRMGFVVLAVVGTLLGSGCSRPFWRSQADFDTYNLLQKKQMDPRWSLPRTTVDADPRSRFYDPFDPDCAPLPPDDPAASQYMNAVHGMRGYKSWHEFGESMSVENPAWLANFGLAPATPYVDYGLSDGLTTVSATSPEGMSRAATTAAAEMVPTIQDLSLEQAIELANINSRDYQTQVENAYLSALQLTLDQFQFNVRYLGLGAREPTGTFTNTRLPGGGAGRIDRSSFGSRFGVSQLLPTGGQWIVEMANNTLWLFSGGNQTNSASVLSYSLVQPLLLGAGRKIVLENLTLSEREVLYDMRTLARYRKLFFADSVAAGQGGNAGGGGGGATISGVTVGGTTASASGVGFLGLIQQMQQIRNQRDNIQGLYVQTQRQRELIAQTPFRRLELGALPQGIEFPATLTSKIEYLAGSRVLRWKVTDPMTPAEQEQLLALSEDAEYRLAVRGLFDQLRTGVITADMLQLATRLTQQENQLRTLERNFQDALDRYKLFLGLPTDMSVTLDRTMLKQFQLIDPHINELELEVLEFADLTASIDDEDPPLAELRSAVKRLSTMIEEVRASGIQLIESDFQTVSQNTAQRLAKLKFEASRDLVEFALERDRVIFRTIRGAFEKAATELKQIEKRVADDKISREDRQTALIAMREEREELFTIVQNLRVVQVGLRAELISLPEFEMPQETAVALALDNRLDLMTTRGRVMDARRAMEVAANRLEAVLNVVAAGDIGTSGIGNRPLDFRADQSSFRLGLQMTAPIDQVAERNAYRASLIGYQRAKREYMRLEDQVKFEVRTDWRQLSVARLNFETTRKNLRQAALQLDIVVENAKSPSTQQQVGRGGTTASNGNTGLNLLNALNSVLQAQNDLVQTWVDYERNRINIHRDMDIMVIDERGLWVDPVYQGLSGASTSHPMSTPANVQPAEPAPLPEPAAFLPLERDGSAGSVRLVAGSRSRAETKSVERADHRAGDRDPLPGWWDRLLARDPGAVGAATLRDRGVGFGVRQEGPLPDHGDGEGDARQYEERLTDE